MRYISLSCVPSRAKVRACVLCRSVRVTADRRECSRERVLEQCVVGRLKGKQPAIRHCEGHNAHKHGRMCAP